MFCEQCFQMMIFLSMKESQVTKSSRQRSFNFIHDILPGMSLVCIIANVHSFCINLFFFIVCHLLGTVAMLAFSIWYFDMMIITFTMLYRITFDTGFAIWLLTV